MGYVENILLEGERVRYRAWLHWITVLPWVGVAVFAPLSLLLVQPDASVTERAGFAAIGLFGTLIGVGKALAGYIAFKTTEIAITDHRLILKRGWIRRDTIEIYLSKVESVDVRQSIFGRIFGFGTVIVRGAGIGAAPLAGIDNPLALRRRVLAN